MTSIIKNNTNMINEIIVKEKKVEKRRAMRMLGHLCP